MLKLANRLSAALTLQLQQGIVIRYTPKRSVFDKTTYNEDWIPRQTLYSKHRKPRQPEWDDPKVVFPKLIPALHKPCSYKHYVKTVIEEEEREKAMRSKEYLLGDVRPGDIVDITYQETFENDQTVTYRGLVLSFKRRNSWSAALELGIRFGGMSLKCIYLIHSPKVKKIELISRGSGCFRGSLKDGWKKLNKQQLTTPLIRKRVMKPRQQGRKKKTVAKKQATSIKYDEIVTDNVRRLV